MNPINDTYCPINQVIVKLPNFLALIVRFLKEPSDFKSVQLVCKIWYQYSSLATNLITEIENTDKKFWKTLMSFKKNCQAGKLTYVNSHRFCEKDMTQCLVVVQQISSEGMSMWATPLFNVAQCKNPLKNGQGVILLSSASKGIDLNEGDIRALKREKVVTQKNFQGTEKNLLLPVWVLETLNSKTQS